MSLAVDLGAVALIVLNAALGYRYGLVRRILAAAGFFGAVGVATLVGNSVVDLLYGSGKPRSLYAAAWGFLAVTGLVTLAVELLGALYRERIRNLATLTFDRSVAVALGAVVGFFEIALCCLVGLAVGSATPPSSAATLPVDHGSVADSVRASVTGGGVNRIEGSIRTVLRPVLPADLAAHLAEETRR